MTTPAVCLVSASQQNVFFGELLGAIGDALSARGIAVEHASDHFPELRDDLVYVVVPHEFLPLVDEAAHPAQAQIRRTIALCTEQPGTQWFELGASFAERSGACLDINQLGTDALRRRGVPARYLPLGYIPAWDRWHADETEDRPVDVVVMAGATPRRLQALARCGPVLARHRTALHLAESWVPHTADSVQFLAGEDKWELLRRSKVLLNIHRDELGYLEWQRVIEAMVNGAVVLTEHSLGFAPLVPGEHFQSASYETLDVALEAVLLDPELQHLTRQRAYALLREGRPLEETIAVLADCAAVLAAQPVSSSAVRGRATVPLPRPARGPDPEYVRLREHQTELSTLRMAVKELLLQQRELRAGLRELREGAAPPDAHTIARYGPPRARPPRVSVLLTVYNYAGVVETAVASVGASDFTDYELVVVDDASSDGSDAAIREALERRPWIPATVATRTRNRGLPHGRNLAAQLARGELLFILDADNCVYPHALGRLVEALDEAPSAQFAYGIIEQFGPTGPGELMSFLPWDPRRLRYGNFIDAMAMLRRSALLEAGGYTTDTRLHGWEDFALWCAFADRGWSGVRVPEIVARYRTGLHSMISVTNIDGSAAWSTLVDRYRSLTA